MGKMYHGSTLIYREPYLALPTYTNDNTAHGDGPFAIVASATPHAKGTAVEVINSTDAETQWIEMSSDATSATSATNTATLFDIGIGANIGSITWLVSGIQMGWMATQIVGFPCPIPNASKVWVRSQSAVASKSISVQVRVASLPWSVDLPIPYQVNTSTSSGLVLAAPSSAGVAGAWSTMVASTSVELSGLLVSPGGATDTNWAATSNVAFEIGVGAASSEVVIGTYTARASTSEQFTNMTNRLIGCSIPAGSRIAARFRGETANTGDLILHGIPAATT